MAAPGTVARRSGAGREPRWMGFRPTLPDALPVIGTSSKVPGCVRVRASARGVDAGGITGRIVADLARGAEPRFASRRFGERFDSKPW